MATPIRNTVRSAAVKSAYNLAYIQNSAGSTISGSIRQYATYAEMLADPAPTRLASVLNGSYDDNYQTTVPQEHWGGVLYQRDEVNNTWILLYNTSDITVPTRVDWEHVVNVPAWVGGVSYNRKKLTQNSYAETRTTYYSYGDFILVLPDPDTVKLGDQIVLEQYTGQGAICYPYAAGEESMYLVNIDGTLETTELCHVIYTTADYAYTRDAQGQMVIDTTNPISHHSYMFTCTENAAGARIWRYNANDDIEDTVIGLRREFFKHARAIDPHHQYIRKNEIGKYVKSLVEISYTLPDAESFRLGGVYLATIDDITSGKAGNKAVTALGLNTVLTGYAVASHNHNLAELNDVSGTVAAGVVPMWSTEQNKFILTTITSSGVTYDDASVESRGLVRLATAESISSGFSGVIVPTAQVLSTVLADYTKRGDYPNIIDLKDVAIDALVDGKVLTVGVPAGQTVPKVVISDYPDATDSTIGCVKYAVASDIVSGTTVSAKAITPVQLINVSSSIIEETKQMIQTSGYVLPSAVTTQLGGVRLINNETLSLVMNDYPEFSSHIVDECTVVNPMQFASYFYNISSNVVSGVDVYMSARMNVMSQRVDSLTLKTTSASDIANSALIKTNNVSGTVNNISAALTNVYQTVGSTVSMAQYAAAEPASATVSGHVLTVYNAGGSKMYPSIVYSSGMSILTHNFSSATLENWTVMCMTPISL